MFVWKSRRRVYLQAKWKSRERNVKEVESGSIVEECICIEVVKSTE